MPKIDRSPKGRVKALVDKKASASKKRKEQRDEIESVEHAVYEFVKKVEEVNKLLEANGKPINSELSNMMWIANVELGLRIRKVDPNADWDTRWTEEDEIPQIVAIDITWSEEFAAKQSINRECSVSVVDVLMRYCM